MIDICGCFCSRKWVNNKYCNVAHSRLLGSLWDLSKAERFLLPWFRMAVSFIQSLLACGFDFKHSIWLPFVATFAALKGFITVPVETMGHFQPWDNPFQNVGLWALPKVESSARTCVLLSQINAAGQLQWQFTSGFDLRNSLWLPFTVRTRFIRFPQGTMGPFQLGDNNPFQTLMELLGIVKSRQLGAHLRLTFQPLCCGSASVMVYLWFQFQA